MGYDKLLQNRTAPRFCFAAVKIYKADREAKGTSALKTLPESDCIREPTRGMMLCYEGLISVLLEIISNDFLLHSCIVCVCVCVFVPLYST